jgi:anti-sigma regulatory factor (Ser/Thr protein kinase)
MRHEAFFYSGPDEFVNGATAFIRAALEAEEPVLVVVGAPKIAQLREALDGSADSVHFADMADVGANPARIIPAWRDFVTANAAPSRGLRGIGEPIFPERGPDELVECQRHESLLNVAFEGVQGFRLMCPYDVVSLEPHVVDEARRSHPFVWAPDAEQESDSYRGDEASAAPFTLPLPAPRGPVEELEFDSDGLQAVRTLIARSAARAGLGAERTDDAILAVNELATNSIRHGGGRGTLRAWQEGKTLIYEVRDSGVLDRPLVGRELPKPGTAGGHGLWLANQLCDLVQIRALPDGNVVRIHVRG